jgi:hypothetical protein
MGGRRAVNRNVIYVENLQLQDINDVYWWIELTGQSTHYSRYEQKYL